MSTSNYINLILEILQINDFTHFFIPAPFDDSSSRLQTCFVKFDFVVQ